MPGAHEACGRRGGRRAPPGARPTPRPRRVPAACQQRRVAWPRAQLGRDRRRRSRGPGPAVATGDAGTTSASRTSPGCPSGTDTRTGPGPPGERRVPRPRQDARHLVGAADAPGALHERLVDRHLVRVAAEVELLVGATPLVVGRHVARDATRSGTESNAAVATPVVALVMPGPTWRSSDAGSAARACEPVSGVRRDLLVARRHEAGCPEAFERGEHARCWCGRTVRRPARRRGRPGSGRRGRRPWASPRHPDVVGIALASSRGSVPHVGSRSFRRNVVSARGRSVHRVPIDSCGPLGRMAIPIGP